MKKSIETLVNEYNDFKIDKLTLVKGIYKAMNVSIRSRNNLKLFPKLYKKYNLENMSYVPEKELNDIMEDNTLIAAIDLIRSDSDHIRTIYISNL